VEQALSAILLFAGASFFFALAETSLFSISPWQLAQITQRHPRRGKIVASAITSLDIHDLARSARTYAVRAMYVVHPVRELRDFATSLRDRWLEGQGRQFDSLRREALERVAVRKEVILG